MALSVFLLVIFGTFTGSIAPATENDKTATLKVGGAPPATTVAIPIIGINKTELAEQVEVKKTEITVSYKSLDKVKTTPTPKIKCSKSSANDYKEYLVPFAPLVIFMLLASLGCLQLRGRSRYADVADVIGCANVTVTPSTNVSRTYPALPILCPHAHAGTDGNDYPYCNTSASEAPPPDYDDVVGNNMRDISSSSDLSESETLPIPYMESYFGDDESRVTSITRLGRYTSSDYFDSSDDEEFIQRLREADNESSIPTSIPFHEGYLYAALAPHLVTETDRNGTPFLNLPDDV